MAGVKIVRLPGILIQVFAPNIPCPEVPDRQQTLSNLRMTTQPIFSALFSQSAVNVPPLMDDEPGRNYLCRGFKKFIELAVPEVEWIDTCLRQEPVRPKPRV